MVKPVPAGLQIHIRLTPKAARDAILGWVADVDGQPVLKVSVTAVPEKGKANDALIALLAKSWKLPKTDILLVRGDTDRNKTLILRNLSALPSAAPPLPEG
jgi:uncharacterized protein (TIGR00251 family)